MNRERLKHIWERVKNEINKQDTRLRSVLHEVNGERLHVWQWIKSATSSPKKANSVCKQKIIIFIMYNFFFPPLCNSRQSNQLTKQHRMLV